MPRHPTVPSYRHHRPSGQAVVTLAGRDHYLGAHNSPESHREYRRLVAEYLAGGGNVPLDATADLTVSEVLDAYWAHAQEHYRRRDPLTGELTPSTQVARIKQSLRPVRDLYGATEARRFGPIALKAVRQEMVRRGLARSTINQWIDCVRRCFAWAVSEELVPPSVAQALSTVEGLRAGRTEAREPEPVGPVPEHLIEPTKALLLPVLRAVVDVQLWTGARAGEILPLRPCDVDRTGPVWFYRPLAHKTAHHGHERTIFLGPRAQAALAPYLDREPTRACFSAAESLEAYLAAGGLVPRTRRRKRPGEAYDVTSYSHAVGRACARRAALEVDAQLAADPALAAHAKRHREGRPAWAARLPDALRERYQQLLRNYHWHPHQLRHNAASRLKDAFGWDLARIVLGHRTVQMTQVYAADNLAKACTAMAQAG